jgi:hypothetical protein
MARTETSEAAFMATSSGKNKQPIVCRQKPLCRRHNLNFDCGE